jgi:hypothetical protein
MKENERTNELAQEVTRDAQLLPAPALAISARSKYGKMPPEGRYSIFHESRNRMYDVLSRTAAIVLVQLRTNMSRLDTYLQDRALANSKSPSSAGFEWQWYDLLLLTNHVCSAHSLNFAASIPV